MLKNTDRNSFDTASLESRIHSIRRSLSNLDQFSPEHVQLETVLQEVEKELENSKTESEQAASVPFDRETVLNWAVAQYSDAAKIYSSMTVVGPNLPAVERLSTAAVHFLAGNNSVYEAILNSHPTSASLFEVTTFDELLDVVRQHPRIALVGEPGAGKTTTLQALAHSCAMDALSELQQGISSAPVPIFLELGEILDISLEQALDDRVRESLPLFGEGNALYRYGETILFLDGFNEVSDNMARDITMWIHNYPNAKIILSSRAFDYDNRSLPLRRIEIRSLNPIQVRNHISQYLSSELEVERLFWAIAGQTALTVWRWYEREFDNANQEDFWLGEIGPTYDYEVEKSLLSDYQDAVRKRTGLPGSLDVVANPYLLTAAIYMFIQNSELPNRRGRLIEALANFLSERIEVIEDKEGSYRVVGPDGVRVATVDIAYNMLKEGRGTGASLGWIDTTLIREEHSISAKPLAVELERANVATLSRGTRQTFKFQHQLLQEHFASLKIASSIGDEKKLTEMFPDPPVRRATRWDEAVLLLASRIENATSLIVWLAGANPTLAYRAALEAGNERVDDRILEILRRGNLGIAPCPVALADWYQSIAHIDHRPGVGLLDTGLPDIDWVRVPAGTALLGGDEDYSDFGLAFNEVLVDFSHDYYLSRYPVTVAQFAAFVEKEESKQFSHYRNDIFWSELGVEWRGENVAPLLWGEEPYNVRNQPVVGVNWFEADAFSKWISWLMEKGRIPSPEPDIEFTVSLPLVTEWEYAARYPDDRRFPWGDDYELGSANVDETYDVEDIGSYRRGKPTAVGIYESGISHLGLHDLSGNVWEWCASKWLQGGDVPDNVDVAFYDHRCVRGGSWYNTIYYAASTCNDCHDIDSGCYDIGFRITARRVNGSPSVMLAQDIPSAGRLHSHTELLIMGSPGAGKTQLLKALSDMPPVLLQKRRPSLRGDLEIDYGRTFIDGTMIFLYTVKTLEEASLLRDEFRSALLVLDGTSDRDSHMRSQIQWALSLWEHNLLVSISRLDSENYRPLARNLALEYIPEERIFLAQQELIATGTFSEKLKYQLFLE